MKRMPLLYLIFLLAACAPAPTVNPTSTTMPPTPLPPTVAFTPIPTFTEAPPPTATPTFDLNNDGLTIAYDFTAHLCEANWMNSIKKGLPCPGDLNNPAEGYVGLLSGSDQGFASDFAMILTRPAYPSGGGIFGRFPKFQVGPNDEFRASLSCRSNSGCEVEFTLAYYDANGKYQEPFPTQVYRQGVEPPINFILPLNSLSGQSVEFVLVVRAKFQSDPTAAWALWISPRILRP